MNRVLTLVLAGAVLAGPTTAQTPSAQTPSAQTSVAQSSVAQSSGALTPEQVVAARQSALMLSAATFGSMKTAAADSDPEIKRATFAARALARWSRTLTSMFPAGTDLPSSRARPEVWSDRAGFEKAAADYAAATGKLADLAAANDKPGFAAQLNEVGAACQACHSKYRARPQG